MNHMSEPPFLDENGFITIAWARKLCEKEP